MKKIVPLNLLIFIVAINAFSQGIVNKGAGIWIKRGTTLRVTGSFTNQQTGSYVGRIVNKGTLAISKDWINETSTESVFPEDSDGEVILTGTDQRIIGSTRFYDFTKQVVTSSTLTFEAGSTTTVTNSLTLEGASGQLLNLRSSIEGTQWNISPPSSWVLEYLDLKDSNNSSGSVIYLPESVSDSKNNTNWIFYKYPLVFKVDANGSLQGDTNQMVRYSRAGSPVTAVGNYGWELAKWVDQDGKEYIDNPMVYGPVLKDSELTAFFSEVEYTLSVYSTTGGQCLPTGNITVKMGVSRTIQITPDVDYYTTDVKVDGKSVGALTSYTFDNITSDHTLYAIFTKIPPEQYDITASATAGGSINPSGTVKVTEGNDITFSLSADDGFMIDDVKVDGTSVGNLDSYTFKNIDAGHVINAEFKEIPPNQYMINSKAETGGTITPSGQILVTEGDSLTFSIEADELSQIKAVFVDGEYVGIVWSYTFENISSNHEITATFKSTAFRITAVSGSNGTVTPSGGVSVPAGESQLFVFTPDSGYHVESVFIDGTPHGKLVEYEFVDVRANHNLEVNFAPGEEVVHVIHSTASSGGTISPLGRISVEDGSDSEFVILPKFGFKIQDVLVDNVTVGSVENYTFTNVTKNHSLSATFEKGQSGQDGILLGVSVNNAQGGWVTPTAGKYSVKENSTVKLQAIPSEAYVFEGWSIIGGTLTDPRSQIIEIEISGPTEITANFTPIISKNQLIMQHAPIAGGSTKPQATMFIQAGETQQLAAVPASGFTFNKWILTSGIGEIDDPSSAQANLTAQTNVEVIAVFTRGDVKAKITTNVNGLGFIDPEGESSVSIGTVMEATALAATGYKFSYWDITDGGTIISPYSPNTEVIVQGNCQLNANFIASDQTAPLALLEDNTGVFKIENLEKGTTRNVSAKVPLYKVFDFWYCLDSIGLNDTAVKNPFAPITNVLVDRNLTVEARFSKNLLTDFAMKKINLEVKADTMKQASGVMTLSSFPCSPGSFDPGNDSLIFIFNGITYLFPEETIQQLGKKNRWSAILKGDDGRIRISLDLENGKFSFRGRKLLLNNTCLNGEINCSLQVGSRYDYYRFSPWKKLSLKFKKKPDEILTQLSVSSQDLESFSVETATVDVDSRKSQKGSLKIRKMLFALPEDANFDPATDTVSIQVGDQNINIPPGTMTSRGTKKRYSYIDKENCISLKLDIKKGKGQFSIGHLNNIPKDCDDGQLDVYLRLGDYGGGVRLPFTTVKKQLYWKGGKNER